MAAIGRIETLPVPIAVWTHFTSQHSNPTASRVHSGNYLQKLAIPYRMPQLTKEYRWKLLPQTPSKGIVPTLTTPQGKIGVNSGVVWALKHPPLPFRLRRHYPALQRTPPGLPYAATPERMSPLTGKRARTVHAAQNGCSVSPPRLGVILMGNTSLSARNRHAAHHRARHSRCATSSGH